MPRSPSKSRILLAVEALQRFDRDEAVRLLKEELRHGAADGERWKSAGRLAAQIGEIEIAVEAARRYANTTPITLERLLFYWGELAHYGRTDAVRQDMRRLPQPLQQHPIVQHFRGTLASQVGDFVAAEEHYRAALAQTQYLPQTWFALSMFKTFTDSDPDLAAMERVRPAMATVDSASRARFLYGLAKAYHDLGDYDRAFAIYSEGAALRRKEEPWDRVQVNRLADDLIQDFTPEAMKRLTPSEEHRPALFVNGLPRSGTTLVEQILVSNSRVADGGEVTLLKPALIPAGDHSLAGALAYQQRAGHDPWGAVARTYFRLLGARFPTDKLVVDKTLVQSHFMGLLMHALPNARVVWMRRNPEDTAFSCFRTFFTSNVPWSWSLDDIGFFFRLEDRLHAHWSAMFPDRILTVDYQALAADPETWIAKIARHCGLESEAKMFESHKTKRGVLTASVQQVRSPITTSRIGVSSRYSAHLEPFNRAYFG